MSIDEIKVKYAGDTPVRCGDSLLVLKRAGRESAGISSIAILFNEHFHVEVKEKSRDDVRITLTSGGISKEIDLQTFQQLIAMNY